MAAQINSKLSWLVAAVENEKDLPLRVKIYPIKGKNNDHFYSRIILLFNGKLEPHAQASILTIVDVNLAFMGLSDIAGNGKT